MDCCVSFVSKFPTYLSTYHLHQSIKNTAEYCLDLWISGIEQIYILTMENVKSSKNDERRL